MIELPDLVFSRQGVVFLHFFVFSFDTNREKKQFLFCTNRKVLFVTFYKGFV